jgi:hypothetical protein
MKNKAPESHNYDYYIQSSDPVRILGFSVLMFVATKFVVRQQAELSLTFASVAFLFGLPYNPEDGDCIFLQPFSLRTLYSSFRIYLLMIGLLV